MDKDIHPEAKWPKVVILQHRLLHYRAALFEKLREACAEKRIELHLVYGQPSRSEKLKQDCSRINWAHEVVNFVLPMGKTDLIWQCLPEVLIKEADIVILMQENRILSNYPIIAGRIWSQRKVAYWGHGRNFQSDSPGGIKEKWKVWFLSKVDWWFAYTNVTKDILLKNNYPESRITVLNNAIDNQAFIADLHSVTQDDISRTRNDLNLSPSAQVGLFCGSLYADKKLSFLVTAVELIRKKLPNFHLVIIGNGPSSIELKALMIDRPWVHWVGVKKGLEKAVYFKLSKVVLNPGLVGLHILDSFCSGVPIFTTSTARHSPEIDYLKNGINGFSFPEDVEVYADGVVQLIGDEAKYQQVVKAALESARQYTLINMVSEFVRGIESCLTSSRLKSIKKN